VSPILVRPVREQLEHDRIIRLLPGRYRRRFEVGIYPDAVLYSTERSRKLQGVVEVETSESINHLEAMAQWANYGRLKVPFHLYVPVAAIDVARRLSSDHQVTVTEIWSYDNIGDQVRFTLVQKAPEPATPTARSMVARGAAAPAKPAERKAARPVPPARKRPAPPSRTAKPPVKRTTVAAVRKATRKTAAQKRK
jgi:hypothetical protein